MIDVCKRRSSLSVLGFSFSLNSGLCVRSSSLCPCFQNEMNNFTFLNNCGQVGPMFWGVGRKVLFFLVDIQLVCKNETNYRYHRDLEEEEHYSFFAIFLSDFFLFQLRVQEFGN